MSPEKLKDLQEIINYYRSAWDKDWTVQQFAKDLQKVIDEPEE